MLSGGVVWHRAAQIRLQAGAPLDSCAHARTLLDRYTAAVQREPIRGADGAPLIIDCFAARPPAQAVLLLSPGAGESPLRYIELLDDLRRAHPHWAFCLVNHRGQGFSPRLLGSVRDWAQVADDAALARWRTLYVEHFDDYVSDFAICAGHARTLAPGRPLFVLAHSMGATIALRWLQEAPAAAEAAVLNAPMLDIRGPGGVPLRFNPPARALVHWAARRRPAAWALGQRPFQPAVFRDEQGRLNGLTASEARLRLRGAVQQAFPMALTGPASWRWVDEALAAGQRLRRGPRLGATPLLLIVPGIDHLVSQGAVRAFACRQQRAGVACRLLELPQARHEVFNECDEYRDRALDALDMHLCQALAERC